MSNEKCACHIVLPDGRKVALKDSIARSDIQTLDDRLTMHEIVVPHGSGNWITVPEEEQEYYDYEWLIEHKPSEIMVRFNFVYGGIEYWSELVHLLNLGNNYVGNNSLYMNGDNYDGMFTGRVLIDTVDDLLYLDGPAYYDEIYFLCSEYETFRELDKDFFILAYKE